jgi:hypothetical protein
MSTVPTTVRHPLGLPLGSVRALISLVIAVHFWMMLVIPKPENVGEKAFHVPINLWFLMLLSMVFFVAFNPFGSSDEDEDVRMGAPAIVLRAIILIVTGVVLVYEFLNHQERLLERLTPTGENVSKQWVACGLSLLGGLLFGKIMKLFPFQESQGYRAIISWLALLASIMALVLFVTETFIQPNLQQNVDLLVLQCITTALTAFYFGARH